MIHEVDDVLRSLIRAEVLEGRQIAVVFDAPTREWAAKVNAPMVNLYLYDIREDMRRRERGLHNEYDERGAIVARRRPPRYFKLSYLITAWTKRPEDEHRLLSSLLACLLRYEALPPDRLAGTLAAVGAAVPMSIALPPPEDRSFADVWSALGGELKPSLDLVISVPVTASPVYEAGPPVGDEGLRAEFGDMPASVPGESGGAGAGAGVGATEPQPGRPGLPVYGSRPGRPARVPSPAAPGGERGRAVSLRITERRGTAPGDAGGGAGRRGTAAADEGGKATKAGGAGRAGDAGRAGGAHDTDEADEGGGG
ncbi:DUF4255 domain-containing protein [Streptomyces californicus]|uniref:DUF4255 domain-containing protein n=1 Tax=Streptomyces TaxID=1883 RepID=UPI0027959FF4|nr:DUF4255 domain-containing protein [Streptomyces sp. CB04723]